MIFLLLLISVLPVFLIGLYIYKKDRNKEPKKILRRLFICGMISCIPAAIMELLLGKIFGTIESMNLVTLFFYTLISVAFVEELFKWLIVYFVTYNHNEFNELYDAIVYAAFVSLGFACFENIFYVLDSNVSIGIFRALTAVPGHVFDAIIMGNFIGLAKLANVNGNTKLCTKNLILSVLIPVITHTIYDYCLFTNNILFLLLFAIFLVYIYVFSIKKIKRISSNNTILSDNNFMAINNNILYCHRCGSACTGNYCHKCGTKL